MTTNMEHDQEQQPSGDAAGSGQEGQPFQRPTDHRLVRLIKTIVINPERGKFVDDNVIKFKYYNSFNYSTLARESDSGTLTLGVTSPRPKDGKTLVACNLAVSFAMGTQKKTILVDLNVLNPCLHSIFGVRQSPGLSEALTNGAIHVSPTAIENLSVLSAGHHIASHHHQPAQVGGSSAVLTSPFGLDQLTAFRDVLYSLEQEFELIIVDMPSINNEGVPVLFANYFNGLLVVIDSGKTRQEDLDRMFHHVNERQVLGFIFNRFQDDSAR